MRPDNKSSMDVTRFAAAPRAGMRAPERGFALIDAMIAVFVVAVGLTASMDMIMSMQYEMDMYKKYMMMGMLAQSKIEYYDAAAALPPASANGDFGTDFGESGYAAYTWTMNSEPVASAGLSAAPYDLTGKTVKITVHITAKDLKGKSHTVDISSIKTIRGG